VMKRGRYKRLPNIDQQSQIQVYRFLSGQSDPQPAIASKRQQEGSFERQFTVLSRIPVS